MDLNILSIILTRDFNKEYFDLSPTTYLNFSPVADPGKARYKTIQPSKKDPLCYIKHKYRDLWIYEMDGKLVFKPIQRDYVSFGKYIPPTIFWLEYLEEKTFIMYKPLGVGVPDVLYLNYDEKNNKINKIQWIDDPKKATRFIYSDISWSQLLNSNMFAKIADEYY